MPAPIAIAWPTEWDSSLPMPQQWPHISTPKKLVALHIFSDLIQNMTLEKNVAHRKGANT
jgi:hypothetical protein